MLSNGRLYHKAPFEDYGLVMSKTADMLFSLFTFDDHGYPVSFRWNGKLYELTNEIRRQVEP
ncbi:unnamed protein product [Nippostrongylus brasiliensis]|uniref:UPF0598 protein (inferred by orthology to a C. elegans protein) n=1 Tax=Nippostrongylus brasiliensis TaxID=27835 RepID=A0A0N4YC28_NIPBR|nr:unnamed protein product [Nippostrongylus brasiliensis]